MGAWDIGPFDNNDASDWLFELEDSTDTSAIAEALSAVTDIGEEYPEAPECCNALAAAEIIAALRSHPIAKLPDSAQTWVEEHEELDVSSLVPAAQSAIQRIRTDSELKELWDESDDAAKWYETLDDLSARLTAP